MKRLRISRFVGPATIVTAAFIGPGTVTVCTLAGVGYGFDLLWALLFSVLATMALQEMAARLGWVTHAGLGRAIRTSTTTVWKRVLFFGIVIAAIVVGNAAYEAGNIGGAVLGIEAVTGPTNLWPVVLGAIAFAALFVGRYGIIEKLMVTLVVIMSICFLATAVVLRPSITAVAAGFLPRIPSAASTYTYASLGGVRGRAFEKGDVIRVLPARGTSAAGEPAREYEGVSTVGFERGPEWHVLTAKAKRLLSSSEFTISVDSNRMGARLEGPTLATRSDKRMETVPVMPGTIQLPGSGGPIVILADGQTTGGYPRIAILPSSELGRFNQIRPGQSFTFRERAQE